MDHTAFIDSDPVSEAAVWLLVLCTFLDPLKFQNMI